MDESIRATATDVVDSTIPESDRVEYAKRIAEDGDKRKWSFTVVDGFFKQSSLNTDERYDPNDDHFGRVLPTWEDVVKRVKELNENGDDNVKYKLIFCARHGEGFHNVAVEKFGLKAWDDHYSKLPGANDPETGEYLKWGPDPDLTDRGYGQAKVMRKLVENEIDDGMPIPESFYVSPFTRSCETLKTTWDKNRGDVLIVELLRETIGEHLCDKRSKKSEIEKKHNNSGWKFKFEDEFNEDDELFKEDWRESAVDVALRANLFLQKLFDKNEQIVWSCTHSGQIRGMLIATGHRSWTIPTAGMIPIVVKGVKN